MKQKIVNNIRYNPVDFVIKMAISLSIIAIFLFVTSTYMNDYYEDKIANYEDEIGQFSLKLKELQREKGELVSSLDNIDEEGYENVTHTAVFITEDSGAKTFSLIDN